MWPNTKASPPSEELLGVVDVDELVKAYVRTRVRMEFWKWRPNEPRCSYMSTPRTRVVSFEMRENVLRLRLTLNIF